MTETEGSPPRSRRKALIVLGGLAGLLLVLVGLSAYYWFTRKPVAELPAVQAMTRGVPPRYVFSIYGVTQPIAVAVDQKGSQIWVAEGGAGRRVISFDREGRKLFTLEADAPLSPVGLALSLDGRLFVADRWDNVVSIYSPRGERLGEIKEPDGKPWAPLSVAVDLQGRSYITDFVELPEITRHRVLRLEADGGSSRSYGAKGERVGQLMYPYGVAVDERGRMIVTDMGKLQLLDSEGSPLGAMGQGTAPGMVGLPRGVAVSQDQRLYLADAMQHEVLVYDISGPGLEYLFSFGGYGTGSGQIRYPMSVAVDLTGRVYVADRENNRIQVWAF